MEAGCDGLGQRFVMVMDQSYLSDPMQSVWSLKEAESIC